nr:hypothetical protein [Oceanococcus sp. HetDA_MAG_MS8]
MMAKPQTAACRLTYCAALLCALFAPAQAQDPAYPSPEWTARELQNYQTALSAVGEQLAQPPFMQRWLEQSLANIASFSQRALTDPSWLLASSPPLQSSITAALSGDPVAAVATLAQQLSADPLALVSLSLNSPLTPLCTTWALPCTGDPFRYPGVDDFYSAEAEVEPVVFYDRDCARLSGRLWRPIGSAEQSRPGVVIMNGSVQAPETLYWWAAQAMVRAGYSVLSFDPRGQGRSDMQAPNGGQGTNINLAVFWEGLVDAIDFFRSSPERPYPHAASCASTTATVTQPYNPHHQTLDLQRLGIVGHSAGAIGVSVVQSYGAPGAQAWPGTMDSTNPVDAVVAWDGWLGPESTQVGGAIGAGYDYLPEPLRQVLLDLVVARELPPIVPQLPTMGQASEYGLAPLPFLAPPQRDQHLEAFASWQRAGIPAFQFTIAGSTHFEWSLLPGFPASSWCPEVVAGQCQGGWGRPMAEHYTLAWLDRWLKRPGEGGFINADERLLAHQNQHTEFAERLSVYYDSAWAFTQRDGVTRSCTDLRRDCASTTVAAIQPSSAQARQALSHAGGQLSWMNLLSLFLIWAATAHRRRSQHPSSGK